MLPAAIFDMDGLMFDTEKLWVEAHSRVSARYGYEMDPRFIVDSMGVNGKNMAAIVKKYFPRADANSFWWEALAYVRASVRENVPVKDGLYEILEMLHENGVKMAVASGSPIEAVKEYLERSGTDKYFEVLVSSDSEVPPIPSKPEPDIFLNAAEKLGFAPEQCYVFEDSFNGIRAGVAAGARTIMIPDQLQPSEEMIRIADAIYASLSDAAKAIERGDL